MMESRIIEYPRPGGGLDYHSSPLIGEIPTSDYSYYRSIDQLRTTINERDVLQTIATSTPLHINGSGGVSTTDLRAIEFSHKSFMSTSSDRSSGSNNENNGEMHSIQHHHHHHHHENQSNKHQTHNNNHNLMDDRANNNNVHYSSGSGTAPIEIKTKSYRKNRKHNRNASANISYNNNISSSSSTLHHQQNNNYHHHQQQQLQSYQQTLLQQHQSNNSNDQQSPHSNNNDHPEDEMITGPVTGQTKEMKIFTSKADLQLHTQVHMREAKPYKCSQCSKAFANSSYLSQHTRIHLGIKPYRCEICQRKFTQLSHLQQHIRTHTGDKPYKCRHPGCQKAFSQLSNLQSHSRCHQTDKPYKCNSCYKCFSDEPSLLEHIPKHKESKHLKTHICQYCGKSYTQETYLTKHMQKHAERTDKRPPISSLPPASSTKNLTLNTPAIPPMTGDHPYWPKVSPDSAANLTEIIQHQQPQQSHEFPLSNQQQNGHNEIQQQQQQQQQSHHRNSSTNNGGGQTNNMVENHHREDVEDLAMSRQNSNNNGHNMNGGNGSGGQMPPSSTPMSIASSYDTAKTTSNSAFTPINSMPPHLNSLGHHHQLAQRPYLYDAISFPNKNVAQNTGNGFPNQLISLHQIRNYAHQPSGLMSGEHLLSGVTVGPGKDKG